MKKKINFINKHSSHSNQIFERIFIQKNMYFAAFDLQPLFLLIFYKMWKILYVKHRYHRT